MTYSIKATSLANKAGKIQIKQSQITFGTTFQSSETLANPAELFLAAFSACMLKNVERFSAMMNFSYTQASVEVRATRLEHTPRMDQINYELTLYSNDDRLNVPLLKKNIEKHGTIYNTIEQSCAIIGTIKTTANV